MTISAELLGPFLAVRGDVLGLALFALLACRASRVLTRRRAAPGSFRLTCAIAAVIVLAGAGLAEWTASHRTATLTAAFSNLAPTYANDLRKLGHAHVTANTPPDAPLLADLRAAGREWLQLNPQLAELFTVRATGDGQARVVVDFADRRDVGPLVPLSPGARHALAGDAVLDPAFERDARGEWIRFATPVRDPRGRIEAALVIGQPATAWLRSIARWRLLALGGMAVLIAVVVSSATLIALMHAEIREHADTERQLAAAKTAADEASRAKSDFLAVMSHEIRTPLNAVMGFANLLSETKLDEAQRDYLATITSEGQRLSGLINNVLDFTKIEEGRLTLERLPFAPVETANEVLRLLGPGAADKKLELRFEAQVIGHLLIAGDPLRFRQILLNLVDNAIKFTPKGAVTLLMNWTPPAPGATQGQLAVRVRDTGIGIPADKVKDLFQMFMQADTSTTRRYGGTGLGLAICQRLVELMGGEITVRSSHEQGSEFSFALPATPVAAPEEAGPEETIATTPSGRRPRVLVVDDMDTNRFLLEIFLARHGFDPELASGGAEAIRLAATKDYDAILMDLQMPDIDGYTATQRIRAAERPGRHTPIIALTASIAKGTREKCLAVGMDDYMAKPLDLRKFRTLLNNFISASAASAAHPSSPPAAAPTASTPH